MAIDSSDVGETLNPTLVPGPLNAPPRLEPVEEADIDRFAPKALWTWEEASALHFGWKPKGGLADWAQTGRMVDDRAASFASLMEHIRDAVDLGALTSPRPETVEPAKFIRWVAAKSFHFKSPRDFADRLKVEVLSGVTETVDELRKKVADLELRNAELQGQLKQAEGGGNQATKRTALRIAAAMAINGYDWEVTAEQAKTARLVHRPAAPGTLANLLKKAGGEKVNADRIRQILKEGRAELEHGLTDSQKAALVTNLMRKHGQD